MQLINFFALIGISINDLLSIASAITSFILLVGSFFNMPRNRFGPIANYSIGGLVFGSLFQTCMAITASTPASIGALIPMSPLAVDGLFVLSLALILVRWLLLKRSRGIRR